MIIIKHFFNHFLTQLYLTENKQIKSTNKN